MTKNYLVSLKKNYIVDEDLKFSREVGIIIKSAKFTCFALLKFIQYLLYLVDSQTFYHELRIEQISNLNVIFKP